MKLTAERPFADPEAAARKLVEIANSIEPVQDGRIYIEKINAPFLYSLKASGAEFVAGIKRAVERGWLELHESGTYVELIKRRGRGLRRPYRRLATRKPRLVMSVAMLSVTVTRACSARFSSSRSIPANAAHHIRFTRCS
ncbi:hypothetical protein [Bradyrhizobium sp. STM 3561]|uniref:hypothetical protein n=1 Tax=Bradyrhizobium sp. STM 3561 TaxID=578923 RepID=UPI00388D0471